MSDNERELGWDDEIDPTANEFTLLEPGEYDFYVESLTRARFGGSAKLPPCNQAKLKIRIDENTTVEHNLFLHTKVEGMLCQFFKAIGQRVEGERFVPNWNKVPGSTGRCHVVIRSWKGKDGADRQSNEIKKFLPPETVSADAAKAADDLAF